MHPPEPGSFSRRKLVLGAPLLALAACNDSTNPVVPDMDRPALAGLKTHTGWPLPGFHQGLFRNQIVLLNVWASWCGYCRGEHGLLKTLEAKLGRPVYGLATMDKPDAAAAYLRQVGNPFRAAAFDTESRMARAIGQRGVPSTYVIGHDGKVVAKCPGALSDHAIEQILRPGIQAARQRHLAAMKA
jgi:cytochrome c biogenesis protein CcmG, thiol:disulfide interchange protein DsbE